VIEILNKLYSEFDDMSELCNVYKLENPASSYVVCCFPGLYIID